MFLIGHVCDTFLFTFLEFVHFHCTGVMPARAFPGIPVNLGFNDRDRNCDSYDAEGFERKWEATVVLADTKMNLRV